VPDSENLKHLLKLNYHQSTMLIPHHAKLRLAIVER
jgi:hypothetical protein